MSLGPVACTVGDAHGQCRGRALAICRNPHKWCASDTETACKIVPSRQACVFRLTETALPKWQSHDGSADVAFKPFGAQVARPGPSWLTELSASFVAAVVTLAIPSPARAAEEVVVVNTRERTLYPVEVEPHSCSAPRTWYGTAGLGGGIRVSIPFAFGHVGRVPDNVGISVRWGPPPTMTIASPETTIAAPTI